MNASSIGGASPARVTVAARAAADGLSLAAAPAFATMALATAHLGDGTAPVCMAEHGALMSGMVPMYLIMGAFHSGPWLRLIAGRGRG